MSPPIDELYLIWLCKEVSGPDNRDPEKTHWKLFKQLYEKEFVWIVPNDDNRLEDGKELRRKFIANEDPGEVDPDWEELGCSVLELMIALSYRLCFEDEQERWPDHWFWILLGNIGLHERSSRHEIEDVLNKVIYRTYESDGQGGFFPLRNPPRDQRKVELWYQLGAYILEQY